MQTRAASDGIPSSNDINFSELNDNPYIVQRRYEQIDEVLTMLKKMINNKKN